MHLDRKTLYKFGVHGVQSLTERKTIPSQVCQNHGTMAWTRTRMTVLVVVLLAAGAATVAVREIQAHRIYPGLAGVWEGTYFNQRVALKIARTNESYQASFDWIDSGIDIPARNLKPGQGAISFRIAGTAARFAATIDSGMTQMSGRWRQGANDNPLTLKRVANPDFSEPMSELDYTPRNGSDLQGCWKGIVSAGPTQLGVILKIAEPASGQFRAEMDRVDWGGEHIPATSMTRDGDAVRIAFLQFGRFEGKLDRGAGQLAGAWTDDTKTNPGSFSRMELQAELASKNYVPNSPSDLSGHWKGTLGLPEGKLHFVFHIARLPDGSVSATMDNPDQGRKNILATTAQYTPPNVSIMWAGIRGVFNGALQNGKLTGTWRQWGKVHPLTLTRDP
jgi:hypothetical protein